MLKRINNTKIKLNKKAFGGYPNAFLLLYIMIYLKMYKYFIRLLIKLKPNELENSIGQFKIYLVAYEISSILLLTSMYKLWSSKYHKSFSAITTSSPS